MPSEFDMPMKQLTPEHEPRVVDTYVVLDMDRTLLDTDRVIEVLHMLLTQYGVSHEQASTEIDEVKRHTGSQFQLIQHLRNKYPALADTVMEEMIELARGGALDDCVYNGVAGLLEQFENRDLPFGIMTYGTEEDQQFKLLLLRTILKRTEETLPGETTTEKQKAQSIADSWQQETSADGAALFVVPGSANQGAPIYARQVVIIDDKKQNLISHNRNIRGILIDNNGNTTEAQRTITELTAQLQSGMSLEEVSHYNESFD